MRNFVTGALKVMEEERERSGKSAGAVMFNGRPKSCDFELQVERTTAAVLRSVGAAVEEEKERERKRGRSGSSSGGRGEGKESSGGSALIPSPQRARRVVERWLVFNQLGGGKSVEMANAEECRHMRLLPWAGIAARAERTSVLLVEATGPEQRRQQQQQQQQQQQERGQRPQLEESEDLLTLSRDNARLRGRAFCFLPLVSFRFVCYFALRRR